MYLIVVGAEPEGIHLIHCAVKDSHQVALIEADAAKARQVLNNHDIKVFNGDMSNSDIWEEAKAREADAVVATASDDTVNLMTMMLAQKYGIKNLTTLVRHANHQALFEHLGIQILVDPAAVIAERLYDNIQSPNATNSDSEKSPKLS